MGVQAPGLAEEAGEKEGSKATSRGKETKKKAARKRDPKKILRTATNCHKLRPTANPIEHLKPKPSGCLMSSKLSDLAQAHLAVVALLDSPILSPATRRQLEVFRDSLEHDIAELSAKEANGMAAG